MALPGLYVFQSAGTPRARLRKAAAQFPPILSRITQEFPFLLWQGRGLFPISLVVDGWMKTDSMLAPWIPLHPGCFSREGLVNSVQQQSLTHLCACADARNGYACLKIGALEDVRGLCYNLGIIDLAALPLPDCLAPRMPTWGWLFNYVHLIKSYFVRSIDCSLTQCFPAIPQTRSMTGCDPESGFFHPR